MTPKHIHIQTIEIKSQDKLLVNIQNLNIKNSLAILGESGSGKSLILKTLLGLTPDELSIKLEFENGELLSPDDIAFIPQNPFTAFSPLSKIKDQLFIQPTLIYPILRELSIDSTLLDKFPNELSGGQLQRLLFAIAIAKMPKLLLLDEPTTALDEKNKLIIIELIKEIVIKQIKIIFVTHDVLSIEDICEEIIIIRQGIIMERGNTSIVLQEPQNEYTKKLINSNFKLRGYRT